MNYNCYIGDKITKARKEQGIKQTALAQMVEMSRASIVNIEKGRQGTPIEKLYEISFALQKPISYFLPYLADEGTIKVKIESKLPVPLLRQLERLPVKTLKHILAHYNSMKRLIK